MQQIRRNILLYCSNNVTTIGCKIIEKIILDLIVYVPLPVDIEGEGGTVGGGTTEGRQIAEGAEALAKSSNA